MLPRPCPWSSIPAVSSHLYGCPSEQSFYLVPLQCCTFWLAHHVSVSPGMSPFRCIFKGKCIWLSQAIEWSLKLMSSSAQPRPLFKLCSGSVWNHYLLLTLPSAVAHHSCSAFTLMSVYSCEKTNKQISS